jgi:hypothetical protein
MIQTPFTLIFHETSVHATIIAHEYAELKIFKFFLANGLTMQV